MPPVSGACVHGGRDGGQLARALPGGDRVRGHRRALPVLRRVAAPRDEGPRGRFAPAS
jgi:hypothetical protein